MSCSWLVRAVQYRYRYRLQLAGATTRGASQWGVEHVRESTMAWADMHDGQSKKWSKEKQAEGFWAACSGEAEV
jgi:hypothetical protein